MHERRLAGTRRPHHGDELPPLDRKVDAGQAGHLLLPERVDLAQCPDVDDGAHPCNPRITAYEPPREADACMSLAPEAVPVITASPAVSVPRSGVTAVCTPLLNPMRTGTATVFAPRST